MKRMVLRASILIQTLYAIQSSSGTGFRRE
jgi:hypothetical protein